MECVYLSVIMSGMRQCVITMGKCYQGVIVRESTPPTANQWFISQKNKLNEELRGLSTLPIDKRSPGSGRTVSCES